MTSKQAKNQIDLENKIQEFIGKLETKSKIIEDFEIQIDLSILLKTMNYREIKPDYWIKPFAHTLLVIDFPVAGELRLTQWFLIHPEEGEKMTIWNSDSLKLSELTQENSIKWLQTLECTTCRNEFLGYNSNSEKLVPKLPINETLNFLS